MSTYWTPRGVVIDASVATDQLQLQEPNVLYGPAQILTGNVFKLWFSVGYAASGIGYAESTDGLVWTRYNNGAPILTTHRRCSVLMDGSTYVMFALSNAAGTLDKLTSSDGISFTVANAGVLAGTSLTWDAAGVNNTCVFIDDDATWLILYDGSTSGASNYNVGLARSTNQGVTWVKDPASPIFPQQHNPGGAFLTKIGSTYHVWLHEASVGGVGVVLPTDIVHYSGTNLLSLTRSPTGIAFPRSDRDEGYLNMTGQVADATLVEVNGVTYMFYEGMQSGSIACGRIKLATANMTMALLVGTDQGVVGGYQADILYNGGFDRLGVGGADLFQNWVESAGTGAIARTTTVGELHVGSSIAAVKLTAGDAGGSTLVRQDFSTSDLGFTPGATYKLSGYNRGDGTNRGRVRVFGASDIIPTWSSSPVGIANTTYAAFEVIFTVPSNLTSFSLYFYAPAANGGVAYFDDLSLRQYSAPVDPPPSERVYTVPDENRVYIVPAENRVYVVPSEELI